MDVTEWLLSARSGIKMSSALVVVGEQGSGKGLFADALAKVMGHDRVTNTKVSKSNFNAYMVQSRIVVLEGDKDQFEKIKPFISLNEVLIERKGSGPSWETSRTNYVFLCSEFPGRATERRAVVTSPVLALYALACLPR